MLYPTLSMTDATAFAERRLDGDDGPIGQDITYKGVGEACDLDDLAEAMDELAADLEAKQESGDRFDIEVFEGRVAARTHQILKALPVDVLDDRGFWRYLAIEHFWWFIAWRESKPLSSGTIEKYVSNKSATESIPARLFLRGGIAQQGDSYERAWKLERSTDFWRSHVIRVRTGSVPSVAHSFVDLQDEVSMKTDVLRAYGRRLNRSWSNIVPNLFGADEARELLNELYDEISLPDPKIEKG